MATIEKKARINVGKVTYAIYNGLDENGKIQYGDIKGGMPLVDFSVKHNSETSTSSAGGSTYLSTVEAGKSDVSFTIYDLTNDVRCDWYGHTEDALGGIMKSSDDSAPYIALMMESEKLTESRGKFKEYLVLYKGKMSESEEKGKTKEEGKTEFQSYSVAGSFENLDNGDMFYYIDGSNPKFDKDKWATIWGKKVPTKEVIEALGGAPVTP